MEAILARMEELRQLIVKRHIMLAPADELIKEMEELAKLIIVPIICIFLALPVKADTIYECIIDSTPRGEAITYLDKMGRLRVQKVTVYTYLTHDGRKVDLPYKIQHLRDDRPWRQKHPIITFELGMIAGPVAGAVVSSMER